MWGTSTRESTHIIDSAKQQLRCQLYQARISLSPQRRRCAEQRVASYARQFLKRGKRVGGYVALGSELNLAFVFERALLYGASVFLPVVPKRGRRLWFSLLSHQDSWYRHPRYQLLEYAGPVVRAQRLDIVFIPLVGVDTQGFRLGQGGGFYDTTLSFCRAKSSVFRPLLIGVAFDCQRVDRVPRAPWDLQLDYLVTESGVHHFSKVEG